MVRTCPGSGAFGPLADDAIFANGADTEAPAFAMEVLNMGPAYTLRLR